MSKINNVALAAAAAACITKLEASAPSGFLELLMLRTHCVVYQKQTAWKNQFCKAERYKDVKSATVNSASQRLEREPTF